MSLILKSKKLFQLIRRPKAFWNFQKCFLFKEFQLINIPYYPTWLELEISTKCNLDCPRCERQIIPKNVLNQTTSVEIINRTSPIFPYIRFVSLVSGLGEPFLNPDFWQIVKIIKKAGPAVGYTTNGLLLNNENIKKTLDEKVDIVVVSIDSLKEDIYKKIRPESSLIEVINNLENLLQTKKRQRSKKPEIRLGFTVQKSNIEEMPKTIEFAKQFGIDMVYFTAMITHKNDLINESLYLLDPIYVKKIFKNTKSIASRLGIKIRLPNIDIRNKTQLCYYPWNTMFVSYQGNVFCNSCCRSPQKMYFCVKNGKIINQEIDIPAVLLGNLNKESILKIWNNEHYKNLRSSFKLKNLSSPCNNCCFRYNLH